jgi:hypothetical protein
VELYNNYIQFMSQKALEPTLLSFRMWKETTSMQTTRLVSQNKYFLDNFALAYIDILINNAYDIVPMQVKNWKEFMRYLKDYEKVSKMKGE